MKCCTCKKRARYRVSVSQLPHIRYACGACMTEHSVAGNMNSYEHLSDLPKPTMRLETLLVALGIATGIFLGWTYWGVK